MEAPLNCYNTDFLLRPSSRQRGCYKITNPQLSEENFKEKGKIGRGPQMGAWHQDWLADWLSVVMWLQLRKPYLLFVKKCLQPLVQLINRYNKNLLSQLCFKRALLLRTSHYMFRLLIQPSSGVSKHKILKVAVTDPLLKLIRLTIHVTDSHYENQYIV
jgi:hypothetical protein